MQCALPLSTKVQDILLTLGIFYYIDTDAFDLKKKESILTYVVYCQLYCSFYEMRKSIQIMK